MKIKIITTLCFCVALMSDYRAQGTITLWATNLTNTSYTLNWNLTGGDGTVNYYSIWFSSSINPTIPHQSAYSGNNSFTVYDGLPVGDPWNGYVKVSVKECSNYKPNVGAFDQYGYLLASSQIDVKINRFTETLNSPPPFNNNNLTIIALNQIDVQPGFSVFPTGNDVFSLEIGDVCAGNYTQRSTLDTVQQTQKQQLLSANNLKSNNIEIYPNPANDKITIDMADVTENTTVTIINFAGQTIYSNNITDSKTIIDLSSYSPGIYMANIISNGTSKTIKLVKN